jgi:hypothetical protein
MPSVRHYPPAKSGLKIALPHRICDKNSFRLRIYDLVSPEDSLRNDARSSYTIPTKTLNMAKANSAIASKAFAGRSPSGGKAPYAGLDAKWVQMCEGVRKNDQAALEELFRLVKRMSWPPRLDHPAAGSQSMDS